MKYECKKAEFDADFESVENVATNVCEKSYKQKVTENWSF
jgi:hypothetical protein